MQRSAHIPSFVSGDRVLICCSKIVCNLCKSAMIINNNFAQKTYYDILKLQEDATPEQIRAAYRSAILGCHPDKLLKESTTSEHKSGKTFIELQEAWENLGDPFLRSTYDNKLQTMRSKSLMSEDVNLEDFVVEVDEDRLVFVYGCRCGDYFTVESVELTEIGYSLSRIGSVVSLNESSPTSSISSIVIPCGSCSLTIRIIIKAGVAVTLDN